MKAQEYYTRGVERFNKGNYQDALKDFDLCIKQRDGKPVAWDYHYRAATHSFLGNHQKALDDINMCFKLRNGSPTAWDYYWRGVTYNHLKKYPEALDNFNQCFNLRNGGTYNGYPTAWDYYWRGITNYSLGKHLEALSDLNQCFNLRDGSPTAWDYYFRSATNFYLGNHQAALNDINMCFKLRNGNPTAWDYYWYSRSNYKLGYYQAALDGLNKGIKLRGSNPELADYYWRGKAYQKLNEPALAQQDFDRVLKSPATKDYHYYYQSKIYYVLKQYSDALKELNKAIQQLITPPFDHYYYLSAKIYYALGNDKATINNCRQALNFEDNQKYKVLLEKATQRQRNEEEQKNQLSKQPNDSSTNLNNNNSSASSVASDLSKPQQLTQPVTNLDNMLSTLQISFSIPYVQLTFDAKLGEGGFGVVYKGKYHFNDVAIKQLKSDKLTSSVEEEFKQEMAIMAQLRCPNIVQLYGAVTDKTPYCLVMEYMDKGSLFNVLQDSSRNLDWPLKERIALDIAKGLAYLHHEKIIHRDLKSMNVLLDNQYKAKLTDFGLAKAKAEAVSMSTNKLVGTLAWMAPELFERRAVYTEKSDIYSYAVVLWELSSHKLPFSDASNQQLIAKWVSEGERENIPENTPPKLAKLITWGWKAKPEERPTAAEASEFLQVEKELSSNAIPVYQDNLNSNVLSGPRYLSNTLSEGPK